MQRARWYVVVSSFAISLAFLPLAGISSPPTEVPRAEQSAATKSQADCLLKLSGEGLHAETLKKLTPVEKIKTQLQRKVTLEMNQAKLEWLVNEISRQLGINVVLDKKALEEAAFDTATPIDKAISEPLELRHALRLVLNDLALSYVVENDVLLITTKTAQENKQVIKKYPVGEFLQPLGSLPMQEVRDFDSLISLIEALIQPTTWKNNGGPGDVRQLEVLELLIVSNTDEVHEQLEEFFADLRKHAAAQKIAIQTNAQLQRRVVHQVNIPEKVIGKEPQESHGGVVFPTEPSFTMAELVEQIKTQIEPTTWKDEKHTISILGDSLIINQTEATQTKIHKFLKELGIIKQQHKQNNQPFMGNS